MIVVVVITCILIHVLQYMWIPVDVCQGHTAPVEVRGHLIGVYSHLSCGTPRGLNSGHQALQQQVPLTTELSPSQPMVYVFICVPSPQAFTACRMKGSQHCFSHSGHNCFPRRSLSGHPARFSALGKLTFTSYCKACDPSHTKNLKLLSLIQREMPTPTAQPSPPCPSCSRKAGKSRQLVTLILLITGELESSENKT